MTTNHTPVSAIVSGKYDQIMANRITSAELAGNDVNEIVCSSNVEKMSCVLK